MTKSVYRCDCVVGVIAYGIRQPVLYNFALDKRPGGEIIEKPRNRHFAKLLLSNNCRITFYKEDDQKNMFILLKKHEQLFYSTNFLYMKSNTYNPKIKKNEPIVFLRENTGTLERYKTKLQEILKSKVTKQSATFFNILLKNEGKWVVGLTFSRSF